jgi:hypothetical protein
MSNPIQLPPFIKKFRQTVLTGNGTLPAVTEYQRRVTLIIHPQASSIIIKFNDTDSEGIVLQPYTMFAVEGYNGLVNIASTGNTVIYEGLV